MKRKVIASCASRVYRRSSIFSLPFLSRKRSNQTFEGNKDVTKIAMLIVAYTPSLIPQLLANQYASWRKIDYVTTFDFFFLFFHPSTLSLPPFPPFQRERKLGGEEWRGGEGEREGENKSPSVWLSPALSRLSNRGLRSSLLFNLSTE